jgi:hypothetical protein
MTGPAPHVALRLHVLLAAGLLVVGALVTHPGAAYLSDEGAAILQARQLSSSQTWVYENPLPAIDANGDAMPFPQGDEGIKGRAPYARHPLYARVLQAADAVAGTAGYLALSILGTLLAAIAASMIGGRVHRSLAVPVLWIVVFSPLFFDSFIVLAHTLAAAAAVGAVLALLHAVERSGPSRWVAVAGVFVGAGLAAALRSEGAFVGLSLAVAGVLITRSRVGFARAFPPALAAAAGSIAVRIAETMFQRETLGRGTLGVRGSSVRSVSGRLEGFVSTWLLPGDRPVARAAFFLAAGLAAIGLGALLVRMGRRDGLVAALFVVGAAGYAARLVVGDPHPVPGLLVAFPLAFAAVWVVRRTDVGTVPSAVAAGTAALTCAGVLLTQYEVGGSVEWGGRYFAVAVPLVVVPLAAALLRTWSLPEWAPGPHLAVAAALAATTLLTAILAIATLRDSRDASEQEAAAVVRAAARAGPVAVGRPGDRRPIVVTTESLVPQLLWPVFERYRWLVVEHSELADILERTSGAGVRRLVLLTADPRPALAAAAPWYAPEPAAGPDPPVPVVVLNSR